MNDTRGRSLALVLVMALAGACGPEGTGNVSKVPDAANIPASPSLSAEEAAAVLVAMRARQSLGMRADRPYVEMLQADPDALARGLVSAVGFPITATEAIGIDVRLRRTQTELQAISKYGESVMDEWAGLSIDERRGGLVTARFTRDIDRHRAAIKRMLRPDALFEVVPVRWTLVELQVLADRVYDERDWLRSIGATYRGGGVDISGNVALIDITSHNPMASTLATEHFGADGRIRVRVTKPRGWQGEQYTLIIFAETADGRPVEGLDCILLTDDPGAWDAGYSTPSNYEGRCTESVGATGIDIQLVLQGATGPTVVGERRFEMPTRDATIRITVALP